MQPSTWTEWQKQIAKEMAYAGKSAREIGDAINKTKNAVLGYLHRNKISISVIQAGTSSQAPRKKRTLGATRKSPINCNLIKALIPIKRAPHRMPVVTKEEGAMGIPFLEAAFGQCRFMMSMKPPIVCGKPTKSISCNWCKEHYDVVYVKPERNSAIKRQDLGYLEQGLGRDRSPSVASKC